MPRHCSTILRSQFQKAIRLASSDRTAPANPRCLKFLLATSNPTLAKFPAASSHASDTLPKIQNSPQRTRSARCCKKRSCEFARRKPSTKRASRKLWDAPALKTSTCALQRCQADGASGSRSQKRWCSSPMSCCSTNQRIISTWPELNGWRNCC